MSSPLMPKSTAVWLIENTTLTFDQIARFCKIHILEVQGIADGEVAIGIQGRNPILSGELSKEEILKCEKNKALELQIIKNEIPLSSNIKRKKARFTPASRRQMIPDAISWLLKYSSELTDPQIVKLIGTTKTTINNVRNREHWNMQNINARDPVLLSLCTQTALSKALDTARKKLEKKK